MKPMFDTLQSVVTIDISLFEATSREGGKRQNSEAHQIRTQRASSVPMPKLRLGYRDAVVAVTHCIQIRATSFIRDYPGRILRSNGCPSR